MTYLRINRESDWYQFIVNYIIAEILYFIGTGILVVTKIIFSLNMEELTNGTFLGGASSGLFTEALSPEQVDWIVNALLLWPINVLITLFSSLLLVAGFFALIILVPLQTFVENLDIFEGANAISPAAMPVGFLFLICWGAIPLAYILRSSWIGVFSSLKNKIIPPSRKYESTH